MLTALMALSMSAPDFSDAGKGYAAGGNPIPCPPQTFELPVLQIDAGESALLPTDDLPAADRFGPIGSFTVTS